MPKFEWLNGSLPVDLMRGQRILTGRLLMLRTIIAGPIDEQTTSLTSLTRTRQHVDTE